MPSKVSYLWQCTDAQLSHGRLPDIEPAAQLKNELSHMAKVTLKNVVKRYGSVTVVDDLSIEIQDREFAVLVGPSGCGKSTALRMIAGLETITSGEIYIGDRLVNDMAPKDRDIAMVFQNYALY